MPDCPPDGDLAAFLTESLAPDRVPPVAAHVDGCPACQVRLDRLTADSGAVARYKELATVSYSDVPAGGVANPPSSIRLTGLPRVPGFDVFAEIGRGGMGVVYKARHRRLNRAVALKMILAGSAAGTRAVQRFLFEAEALARVQHPQVVQVFEVDTYQGSAGVPVPYLAMELLEGGSLARRLRGGPLAPRDAAELIEGVARAVHAAHLQGVVHRDLKPGNVLFPVGSGQRAVGSEEAGVLSSLPTAHCPLPTPSPKVTDFGLAKFVEAGADLTGSGQVLGTPHYMAPEQAAGGKPVGPPADVYALGSILFECLTGRPPFEGDEAVGVLLRVVNDPPPDVRDLRPDAPRDLAAVAARCLEKEPARRYPTAADLADDLRRFLDARPTVARPVGPAERAWLWARRNAAVAGLLVMLTTGLGLVSMLLMAALVTGDNERRAARLAWEAVGKAEEALDEAKRQRGSAEREKRTADRRGAELEFARAVQTCDEGRVGDGLRLFDEARRLAESVGEADLARAARVNLAAWRRELPRTRRAFLPGAPPRVAAFHPDGRHLVTAGHGEVSIWDLDSGRTVRTYARALTAAGAGRDNDPPPEFRAVAISPDGATVAAGGADGWVTVWDVGRTDPRDAFPAADPGEGVWGLGFARDGALWATAGTGVKRWDPAARPKPAATPLTPAAGAKAGAVTALAVTADGRRVYTGDRAGVIREWDAERPREVRAWPAGGPVADLAVAADGTYLAATGPDGTVRVIDPVGARPPLDIPLGGAAGTGVAFAPTRPLVLAADGDGGVRAWDRDTGLPAGPAARFPGEVARPRFRPGSDEFAVPAGDAVVLCPVPDPPGEVLRGGRGTPIRGLAVSPARGLLAVADDATLDVFDLKTRKVVQTLDRPGTGAIALGFDPDPMRDRLFRGYQGGLDRVAVPDGRKGEPVPAKLGRVCRIAFVRGGKGVVVADQAGVTGWDAAGLKPVTTANLTADAPAGVDVRALAARPDGAELVAAFGNQVVFLDPDTLRPARPGWRTGEGEVLDAAYTPDGARVFVGRRDGVAELRDAATGFPVAGPMPHARAVAAVAVSADGTLLLTGCRDGTARFWDAATGLPLGAPLRHLGPVTHVAFAPGDTHAITGTATGHVVTWNVPPQ